MKHTERYSIQVKNLIFFSNFSKISKFPVISSNGTALQWKNWYFSWYLLKTWYFNETHWTGLNYSGKMRYFVENLIFPVISVKSVKMNNFPLKTTGRYKIWLEKHHFSDISSFWWYFPQIHQTGASYLLKKVILWKSIIFQWNTLNGIAFGLKSWYFY